MSRIKKIFHPANTKCPALDAKRRKAQISMPLTAKGPVGANRAKGRARAKEGARTKREANARAKAREARPIRRKTRMQ